MKKFNNFSFKIQLTIIYVMLTNNKNYKNKINNDINNPYKIYTFFFVLSTSGSISVKLINIIKQPIKYNIIFSISFVIYCLNRTNVNIAPNGSAIPEINV